jgi:hypothetical protein
VIEDDEREEANIEKALGGRYLTRVTEEDFEVEK